MNTMPHRHNKLIAATALLLSSLASLPAAADSMVRVTCEGADQGARIFTHPPRARPDQRVFRGRCPLDFEVMPGAFWIRAEAPHPLGTAVWKHPFEIGEGAVMKVQPDFKHSLFGMVEYSADGAEEVRKKALRGDMAAQRTLGEIYTRSTPLAKNVVEALNWFQKAAAQGDAESMWRVATIYYDGSAAPTVPADKAQARLWYERTVKADDGHYSVDAVEMLSRIAAGK